MLLFIITLLFCIINFITFFLQIINILILKAQTVYYIHYSVIKPGSCKVGQSQTIITVVNALGSTFNKFVMSTIYFTNYFCFITSINFCVYQMKLVYQSIHPDHKTNNNVAKPHLIPSSHSIPCAHTQTDSSQQYLDFIAASRIFYYFCRILFKSYIYLIIFLKKSSHFTQLVL